MGYNMDKLSDLYECSGDAEITVKVLRGGDDSILGQYVTFCKIADEQRALPSKKDGTFGSYRRPNCGYNGQGETFCPGP